MSWPWNPTVKQDREPYDDLWFAIPLVTAETCAYIGLILFTINLWKVKDYPKQPPPKLYAGTITNPNEEDYRPIPVDVFLPT